MASGYIRLSHAASPEICQSREDLHDAAELAISGSVVGMIDRTIRNGATEIDMAPVIHGAHQFEIAQRALELRIEVRHGLRVVPYMRAGAVAAAGIRKAAFPAPDVAVGFAENGRRFEDRQVGGNGVENIRGERGIEERVLELNRARSQ